MTRSTRNINVNAGPQRGGARSFGRVLDNYVAPARSKSGMHSLAKSLGLMGSAFQSVEVKRRNEQAAVQEQEDRARAELQAVIDGLSDDPAKIRDGSMYPQESPAFQSMYTESQARAAATQTVSQWEREWKSWDKRDSNDPEIIKEFFQKRFPDARSAYGKDQYAIAGALPVLVKGMNRLSKQHAEYTANRMKTEDLQSMQIVGVDCRSSVFMRLAVYLA